MTTWIAQPLFNLTLRTSRFGRLALSAEETRTSNWVGLCVVIALAFAVVYLFSLNLINAAIAIMAVLMIPVLATYYACDEGWPRNSCLTLILVMLVLVAGSTGTMLGSFFVGDEALFELLQAAGGLFILSSRFAWHRFPIHRANARFRSAQTLVRDTSASGVGLHEPVAPRLPGFQIAAPRQRSSEAN